jgi:hypothetical protein
LVYPTIVVRNDRIIANLEVDSRGGLPDLITGTACAGAGIDG